jgi:trigger factor
MADKSEAADSSPFQIEVEAPEPRQRVLKVVVPRAYFDREYKERLVAATKSYSRPGFRQGKTPAALVEQELGDRLKAETFEEVVPQAFRSAVVAHDLAPVTDPKLENLSFEADQPITFDLVIEVRPRVEAKDYENLPLQEEQARVADEEVDAVLARLRESHAIYEAVARPAVAGDRLTVDLVPLGEDGEPDLERRAEGQQLILGAEQNLPAFNSGLVGVEAGAECDLDVSYPDDYPNEALAGKTIRFRCNVTEVAGEQLPELNDAFASQFEEGQTLLELRGKIRAQLLAEAGARISRNLEEQLIDRLIERHDVAVPPALVEQYVTSGIEQLKGRSLQEGRQLTEEQEREYRDLTAPIARRVLAGMFIMEAIRRQEGITVDDAEIEDRIVEIAAEHQFDLEQYRQYVNQGDEREKIRHGLAERKTYDFLLSRADVTAAPAAAEA